MRLLHELERELEEFLRLTPDRGITIHDLKRMEHKIMSTQAEVAAELRALKDQLVKANTEIQAKIAELIAAAGNQDNASQELTDAADALKVAAQTLDDVVPDAPAPTP